MMNSDDPDGWSFISGTGAIGPTTTPGTGETTTTGGALLFCVVCSRLFLCFRSAGSYLCAGACAGAVVYFLREQQIPDAYIFMFYVVYVVRISFWLFLVDFVWLVAGLNLYVFPRLGGPRRQKKIYSV